MGKRILIIYQKVIYPDGSVEEHDNEYVHTAG